MKHLKKGCKVIMLALAMLLVVGCKDAYAYASSTETVIKMSEDEKAGTFETKIGLAKNYHKNLEYSSVESVEVFVELLESCVNEELGLMFDVNTTGNETDYITVKMKFKDMEDLNQKLHVMYNESSKLDANVKKKAALTPIYAACFDSKAYSEELAKLIQKDGYICSEDDEWLRILTYRMLTGQNVKNMADIEASQDKIFAIDFSEADVNEYTDLGLEKTEYGYQIYAGVINVITHYIDSLVSYNSDCFYYTLKLQSELSAQADKVVYEQFLDTYYNDINIAYVMNSCFPEVVDIAEIDTDILLSKLELSDSKQADNIYDMYASKIDVNALYKYPMLFTGASYETEDKGFKLYVGDTLYTHITFYDMELASDTLFLTDESSDMTKEDIKNAIIADKKAKNMTVGFDDTPDTADSIQLYILGGIALLATVGIAIALVMNKRKMYV